MSKKPTAKQLAARRKFAAMAKSGKLAALRKKASKSKKHTKKGSKSRHRSSKPLGMSKPHAHRPRTRGGTNLRRTNIDDSLLLAIQDPNVKEIIIKK